MSAIYKYAVLISVFILLFTLTAGAVELKDVPQDHWAYESVKELVEKGYLSLYEDGTFSGTDKVSRYELAVLIARILENIETGKQEAGAEDVETLRKLSLEFRDELVDIAKTQDMFTESMEEMEKRITVIENEDIARLHERINQNETGIEDLNERLSASEQEIARIIDNIIEIKKLEEKITALNNKLNSLEEEMAATNERVEEREATIAGLKEEINSELKQKMDNQHSVTSTRISSLQQRVSELEEELAATRTAEEEAAAEEEKDQTALYLGVAALVILLAGMG